MISDTYCATMARYNRWQNEAQFAAAGKLDDAARRMDRGAFFGSIHGTLCHLLWGDGMWMSRFDGGAPPEQGIAESPEMVPDWETLAAARSEMDARILRWASDMGAVEPGAMLRWYSGLTGSTLEKPLGLCITHFFNHQTHHRGQVHAMLTAAGARPGTTDLAFMDGI